METLLRRPNGLLLLRRDSHEAGSWRDDPQYKLLVATAGELRCRTSRQRLSIQPGQFLILNPHERHQQLGFDREKLLIELSPALLREVAESVGLSSGSDVQFALQLQKHPQLTQWAGFTMETLRMAAGEEGRFFFDHALAQLALLLLKVGAGSHSDELSVVHLHKTVLYRAVEAMKQDYARPWTLAEMGEAAGVNKFQFAHLFKETAGISPYSWLQLYRLVRSQALLKHTDQSILDVALACGFSSTSVYNQLFKRVYGVSPGAFRKRYRE
ncbi:helix-turn-helix transcriptional regulator [Brevibacillus sp. H7]|jgi:AraC-like DNA-binding protein|uniref:helix-turn-helix transcriptional regulator n=1 Tax=Brevibacillus sp. H7 TaxID=3349138 RepID=UPI00381A8EF5